MPLSLFGYSPKSRVEDAIGSSSQYGHTFGGHPKTFDITFTSARWPLHLIYRLDLRDQLVPFGLPHIDFFPLLYCFNYGCDCCYQVVSNTEIKLIQPGEEEHHFPPWEAPESFPLQSTSFSAKPFDPTNADDVMDWKGVFGWDELTSEERERALDLARERTWLTAEDGPDDSWTYEDVIRCMYDPPFVQSAPKNSCGNPVCNEDRLQIIAMQDHAKSSESIWNGDFVQTVWEMCNSCHCITVSSQCT